MGAVSALLLKRRDASWRAIAGMADSGPSGRDVRRVEGYSMKTNLLGAIAALALVAGVAPAMAQTVEFTIVNDSSQALHYFYTTPNNENSWGEDLLADGTLESGSQGVATIGDGSDQCLYDFKFVMDSGAELIEPAIDICQLDSYTITD